MTRVELLGSAAPARAERGSCTRRLNGGRQLLESILELRQPLLLREMMPDSLPPLSAGQSTGRHGLFISRPAGACLGVELDTEAGAILRGAVRQAALRPQARANAGGALGAVTFEALAPSPAESRRAVRRVHVRRSGRMEGPPRFGARRKGGAARVLSLLLRAHRGARARCGCSAFESPERLRRSRWRSSSTTGSGC